jgi:hypothetical protein
MLKLVSIFLTIFVIGCATSAPTVVEKIYSPKKSVALEYEVSALATEEDGHKLAANEAEKFCGGTPNLINEAHRETGALDWKSRYTKLTFECK